MQPQDSERKAWMGLLARSEDRDFSAALDTLGPEPGHQILRAPEIGGVMVRGRTGGSGAPFNLGEMTVTRCSLKLETGEVGHGYVMGRDKEKARRAALVDAMMLSGAAAAVRQAVLAPLEAAETARKTRRAAKAAGTKVDFFTMVRGEG